jgi:hypothetical protein
MSKSERFTVRVTPRERRLLELAADGDGQAFADWVRRTLKRAALFEISDGEFSDTDSSRRVQTA